MWLDTTSSHQFLFEWYYIRDVGMAKIITHCQGENKNVLLGAGMEIGAYI